MVRSWRSWANWIRPNSAHRSSWFGSPDGGAAEFHRVIRFAHEPLEYACRGISDQGIGFFGVAERTAIHGRRVKDGRRLQGSIAFHILMAELGTWTDHRTLSTVPTRGLRGVAGLDRRFFEIKGTTPASLEGR